MARKYDHEYKIQAVKLAKEIGGAKAAKELGIPEGTIHTWLKKVNWKKLQLFGNSEQLRLMEKTIIQHTIILI